MEYPSRSLLGLHSAMLIQLTVFLITRRVLCKQLTGSQAEMQGFDKKALFDMHFCVHNKVKNAIYWISLLKHGSYWPEEYPKRFRVKHTLTEHDILAQPNSRLQKNRSYCILAPWTPTCSCWLNIPHCTSRETAWWRSSAIWRSHTCKTPCPQRNNQIQTQH